MRYERPEAKSQAIIINTNALGARHYAFIELKKAQASRPLKYLKDPPISLLLQPVSANRVCSHCTEVAQQ